MNTFSNNFRDENNTVLFKTASWVPDDILPTLTCACAFDSPFRENATLPNAASQFAGMERNATCSPSI